MTRHIENETFAINRPRPSRFEPSHFKIMETLGKYPSIIEKTTFDKEGFAIMSDGTRLNPVYVASGYGFSQEGTRYLNEDLYPSLRKMGILPFCPFAACSEFLPEDIFSSSLTVDEQYKKWKGFNKIIGIINYGILMRFAHFMYADLNGYPPDEGVCAEIAYFASNYGEVIGVRTDFRLAENPGTFINPAITSFMEEEHFKGKLFTGSRSREQAFDEILKLKE